MSEKNIEHTGVIQATGNGRLTVSLLRVSACSSCHAKSVCSVSDSESKIVEVYCDSDRHFDVGETVKVGVSENLGLKALAIGYLIPFCLFIVALLVSLQFTSEGIAGILAIAALPPYYIVLRLFRNKFKNAFTFKVMKMQ